MKKSKEKTGYILVRAHLTSEWDSCNCALISYSPERLEKWKLWDTLTTGLIHTDFFCMIFWDSAEFLNLSTKILENLDRDPYMIHITMKADYDFKKSQLPEQRIDCHQMKFYGNGNVQFIAYGKHTSEEFYTETLNLKDF